MPVQIVAGVQRRRQQLAAPSVAVAGEEPAVLVVELQPAAITGDGEDSGVELRLVGAVGGADIAFEADQRRGVRILGRVLAAVAPVAVEVIEAGLQPGGHPSRLGAGEEAQQVDQVGAVAEHHRPRSVVLGRQRPHRPQRAARHHALRFRERRRPAAGVVDRQQRPVALARLDHAVRVLQRGGDRLLAKDRAGARFGGGHGQVGMDVVAGDDADDVRSLAGQHLAEVGMDGGVGEVRPRLPELVERFAAQVAHRCQLGARVLHVARYVGTAHRAPQPARAGGRPPGADSGKSDDGRAVLLLHS